MNGRSTNTALFWALGGAALLIAGGAGAQESGSAATRSLNSGPGQSTLSTRPNAQPPLTAAERSQPSRAQTPRSQPSQPAASSEGDRLLEELMRGAGEPRQAAAATTSSTTTTANPRTGGVTLAAGQTRPEPIPMTLGYYARGDKDCDQVWPGDGDLAWLTPTAFTLDYGGCEPGQFLQTGPNSWGEEQRCLTERGNDGGAYNVTYEVLSTDSIKRTARMDEDVDPVEDDVWHFCRLQDVPDNAQFASS